MRLIPRRYSLFKLALTWLAVSPIIGEVRRACCAGAKDVSMKSRRLAILVRIRRGLLAAVCVFGSILPSDSCCCAAFSCCASQDETSCCTAEFAQGCSCCKQSNGKNDSRFSCSCAEVAVNSSAFFLGTCCCDERPATNGVAANNHRDDQKRDWNKGFMELSPGVNPPATLTCDAVRSGTQYVHHPIAHNLRQATLCVWRN